MQADYKSTLYVKHPLIVSSRTYRHACSIDLTEHIAGYALAECLVVEGCHLSSGDVFAAAVPVVRGGVRVSVEGTPTRVGVPR